MATGAGGYFITQMTRRLNEYVSFTRNPDHQYRTRQHPVMYSPYRDLFGVSQACSKSQIRGGVLHKQKMVDTYALRRWNKELPLSELPNMIIKFLASDKISGKSLLQKSG